MDKVFVYDPTASDKMSAVRGVGRYLQILKENFPNWSFTNQVTKLPSYQATTFINPFFNFLQPPLTLKRLAKKQIAVIHDLIPLKYPSHFPAGIRGNINILRNKLALKNYDLIITDSEASKHNIMEMLKVTSYKIKVIYPCLPKIISNPSSVIRNQKIDLLINNELRITNYCLYVGDATWNKNLVNLARAIKIADVNCVFVGKVFQNLVVSSKYQVLSKNTLNTKYLIPNTFSNPWQWEFKQFLELTKDDKRFIFAGFVPDSVLIKLYQQALVNILPSHDEGFGFSYVESSQFGCPSLLSDIPVLREISDGNALFFDPNNPQEIANKINEINSDKILRNKIGAKAKKRAEFFSPEKFRKDIRSVLVSESI